MKKYSTKFWIIFWATSALILMFWYLFLTVPVKGISFYTQTLISMLPIEEGKKNEYEALAEVSDFFLKKDNKEKKLLVLFQNNLEIRPGGGFIGAFGIVKIKNGKVLSIETHDLSNFDEKVPNVLLAPYPIEQILKTKYWKMRDSNFSPDFVENAKNAQMFYGMVNEDKKDFDGVIAITSNVLVSVLKITGPIEIEGYPGKYDSENAVMALEYQVEKAFEQQGIEREQRKLIMSDLAKEIERRIFSLSISQKIKLAKILLIDLKQKDVQFNFDDRKIQTKIEAANLAGKVDREWNKDFLMIVSANLGSFKSDYYLKRSFEYTVDLSKDLPTAKIKITYQHTAKQKDWMTRDYVDYVRIYVPREAEIIDSNNFENVQIDNEFGKKYFGSIVRTPIGTSNNIELSYTLPKSIKEDYNLKIQKQSGLGDIPLTINVKKNGIEKNWAIVLNEDKIF